MITVGKITQFYWCAKNSRRPIFVQKLLDNHWTNFGQNNFLCGQKQFLYWTKNGLCLGRHLVNNRLQHGFYCAAIRLQNVIIRQTVVFLIIILVVRL